MHNKLLNLSITIFLKLLIVFTQLVGRPGPIVGPIYVKIISLQLGLLPGSAPPNCVSAGHVIGCSLNMTCHSAYSDSCPRLPRYPTYHIRCPEANCGCRSKHLTAKFSPGRHRTRNTEATNQEKPRPNQSRLLP